MLYAINIRFTVDTRENSAYFPTSTNLLGFHLNLRVNKFA